MTRMLKPPSQVQVNLAKAGRPKSTTFNCCQLQMNWTLVRLIVIITGEMVAETEQIVSCTIIYILSYNKKAIFQLTDFNFDQQVLYS